MVCERCSSYDTSAFAIRGRKLHGTLNPSSRNLKKMRISASSVLLQAVATNAVADGSRLNEPRDTATITISR
jgi:hypothetical protein